MDLLIHPKITLCEGKTGYNNFLKLDSHVLFM